MFVVNKSKKDVHIYRYNIMNKIKSSGFVSIALFMLNVKQKMFYSV